MHERREGDSENAGFGVQCEGEEHDSDVENPCIEAENPELSTTEEEFVAAYLDAGAPVEREVIESNIEDNINALGGVARTEVLVEAIQREAPNPPT
jgi:hypothetical protein